MVKKVPTGGFAKEYLVTGETYSVEPYDNKWILINRSKVKRPITGFIPLDEALKLIRKGIAKKFDTKEEALEEARKLDPKDNIVIYNKEGEPQKTIERKELEEAIKQVSRKKLKEV